MKIADIWRTEGLAAVSRRLNRGQRWIIAPYQDSDEAEALALFKAVYGKVVDPDVWRWKYQKNPDGPPLMLTARDKETGRLVAYHGAVPFGSRIGEDNLKTFLIADTMVDPTFRNRGLYIDISIHLFDLIFSHPDAFGIGLPNDKAFSVNDALRMPTVDTLRLYAAVLDWKNLLRGRIGVRPLEFLAAAAGNAVFRPRTARDARRVDPDIREVSDFPDDIETFCRRVLASHGVASRRNAPRLRWRFLNHPRQTYKVFMNGSGTGIKGYVVVGIIEQAGLRIGTIVDFVFDQNLTDGLSLLESGMRYFLSERADVAIAMTTSHSDLKRTFNRAGYVSSRLRWTRRPFHFLVSHGWNKTSEREKRHEAIFSDPKAWFFNLGDTDIV